MNSLARERPHESQNATDPMRMVERGFFFIFSVDFSRLNFKREYRRKGIKYLTLFHLSLVS